jgi:putative two-component system response regulator
MAPGRRAGKVLVVDDLTANTELFTRILTGDGFDVISANSGEDALVAVAAHEPEVVLLDVMMPGLDGFETCRRLKSNPASRLIPVVLVTALCGRDDRLRGVEVGADGFLAKPPDWRELTARVQSLIRLKRYTDDLESAESVILSLAMTIEIRDPYTEGHCQRIANYAAALGERLGLPDQDLEALYRGGFLHDLGKIGIPDTILLKPGPLTPAEFEVVKQHPVIGSRLCEGLRTLRRALPIIRSHHERLDGSGYPDGLAGDAVPLLAQILSIVDIYDALTTPRPYKPALSRQEAQDALIDEARKKWRSLELVQEFLALSQLGHATCDDTDWLLRLRFGREGAGGHYDRTDASTRRQGPHVWVSPQPLDLAGAGEPRLDAGAHAHR